MPLVDDTAVKNYLGGIKLPAPAAAALPTIIAGRQADLETFLGYSIDPGVYAHITETVAVNRDGYLVTSAWPIGAVETLTDAAGGLVSGWQFTPDGMITIPGPVWDAGGYTVTYTPGLPPAPLAMATVDLLLVVGREIAALHDDTRGNNRDTSGRALAKAPVGWQPAEKRKYSRWRRRGVVYSRPQAYGPTVAPGDMTTGYGQWVEIGGVSSLGPYAVEG